MRKLKQRIASALIVTMLTGMSVAPAYAEELHDNWWYYGELEGFEKPGWYYIKGGEPLQSQLKMINQKMYAFDESGRMYQNEVFQNPKFIGEENEWGDVSESKLFANPDGDLALYWIKLNAEEETLYDGEGPFSWYYIRGEKNNENINVPREMYTGVEATINKQKYAFEKNGVMISRQIEKEENGWARLTWSDEEESWVILEEDDERYDEVDHTQKGMAYYTYDGSRAVDKVLPLGDFWYYFASEKDEVETDGALKAGMVKDVRCRTKASDSNAEPMVDIASKSDWNAPAPAQEVVSIIPEGNAEINGVVAGETVKMKFKVNLASDSNVEPAEDGRVFEKRFHDILAVPSKSGKAEIEVDEKNAVITVKYTPQMPVDEAEMVLYVDDIESEAVVLRSKSLEDMTENEAKNIVESLLDSLVPENNQEKQDILPADVVKENISSIYTDANEGQKKTIQKSLLDSKTYDTLVDNIIMMTGAKEEVAELNEDTVKALGNGTISLKGAVLEDRGDVVLDVLKTDASQILPQEENAQFKNYANTVAFDITLSLGGDNATELTLPARITMPVPAGYSVSDMKLFHIHDGNEEEVRFKNNNNGTISFMADKFSAYVFAQDKELDNSNNHQNNHGGSSSDSGTTSGNGGSAGIVISDPRKGYVNSVTGIITGTGDGYSKWQPIIAADGKTIWKLQYADGSFATGSMLKNITGSDYEQVHWELINGAWYAFGADGYAKNGFVYDVELGGTFYIDIDSGMKTGWQMVDGKWYYFNPVSDGKCGIMRVSSWIDGWYVGNDGVWDENKQNESR